MYKRRGRPETMRGTMMMVWSTVCFLATCYDKAVEVRNMTGDWGHFITNLIKLSSVSVSQIFLDEQKRKRAKKCRGE